MSGGGTKSSISAKDLRSILSTFPISLPWGLMIFKEKSYSSHGSTGTTISISDPVNGGAFLTGPATLNMVSIYNHHLLFLSIWMLIMTLLLNNKHKTDLC